MHVAQENGCLGVETPTLRLSQSPLLHPLFQVVSKCFQVSEEARFTQINKPMLWVANT